VLQGQWAVQVRIQGLVPAHDQEWVWEGEEGWVWEGERERRRRKRREEGEGWVWEGERESRRRRRREEEGWVWEAEREQQEEEVGGRGGRKRWEEEVGGRGGRKRRDEEGGGGRASGAQKRHNRHSSPSKSGLFTMSLAPLLSLAPIQQHNVLQSVVVSPLERRWLQDDERLLGLGCNG
jgi:hypothetical protein